jgi:hypothetical protein
VKLWPTLVFLNDGREVARLVRPTEADAIRRALADIDARRAHQGGTTDSSSILPARTTLP